MPQTTTAVALTGFQLIINAGNGKQSDSIPVVGLYTWEEMSINKTATTGAIVPSKAGL